MDAWRNTESATLVSQLIVDAPLTHELMTHYADTSNCRRTVRSIEPAAAARFSVACPGAAVASRRTLGGHNSNNVIFKQMHM
jgi:hypothetical protein